MTVPSTVYRSSTTWEAGRPHVLVAACSDGRLQEAVDEFLSEHLGIVAYDRLYLPGGPGALSTSGVEYMRSHTQKQELQFLVEVHEIEEVVLLFHGPTEGGPLDAVCADYARVIGKRERDAAASAQQSDLKELLEFFGRYPGIRIHAYRCEVGPDHVVNFVDLLAS